MILTGLIVGAALGFVLQRGRFCVTGAFRDVWVARKTRWLTAFLIVIAVQSVGLFGLQAAGVIHLDPKPVPLLATVVGGLVFGFAIVLAGGCATGTYYRAGEGLVGSWVALGLYAATSAVMKYGPLASVTTSLRGQTSAATTIDRTLGVSPWLLVAPLVAGVGYLAWRQLQARPAKIATLPPRRTGLAHLLLERSWHPFATALIVGVIAIVAWPLSAATGRNDGLGITTPSANLVSWLVTGDGKRIDWGVMLVLGLLVGSFVAAKASGEFRVRVPSADTILKSVAGGVLMGVGASLAGGCTIGNAMVQTAQLSWQGWIAFACMLLGVGAAAWLTIIRPSRRAATVSATSTAALSPSTV